MEFVRILKPSPDDAPARFGQALAVVVDLEVEEPWFPTPDLGLRLHVLDGEAEPALIFDTVGARAVRALVSGDAEKRDGGRDDHSGPPARPISGGRGCEITITSGSLCLTYSHLKRGSARSGRVRAGETVGMSGNTGRCVSGSRSSFVKIAAKVKGLPVRLESFAEPITVEMTLNGYRVGSPTALPAGESVCRNFHLKDVAVDLEPGEVFKPGENELEVTLRRGARVLARDRHKVLLES